MKEIQFQGKKFLIEEEKSIDKTHFVIDIDALENWAKSGRADLVILNIAKFYQELQQHPEAISNEIFLKELKSYATKVKVVITGHITQLEDTTGYTKFTKNTSENAIKLVDLYIKTFERLEKKKQLTKTDISEEIKRIQEIRSSRESPLRKIVESTFPNDSIKEQLLALFEVEKGHKFVIKLQELFKNAERLYKGNTKLSKNTLNAIQNLANSFFTRKNSEFMLNTAGATDPRIIIGLLFMSIANSITVNGIFTSSHRGDQFSTTLLIGMLLVTNTGMCYLLSTLKEQE